jgi:hypothetical protein
MDPRVVSSLIAAIIFLVMASPPVFSIVRDMGVKDKDMSLVVRSVLAGLLTYVSMLSLM